MADQPPRRPRGRAAPRSSSTPPTPPGGDPLLAPKSPIVPALSDPTQRQRVGLPAEDDAPGPIMVELNMRHRQGLPGARDRFLALYPAVLPDAWASRPPAQVSPAYFGCALSMAEVRRLLEADASETSPRDRAIFRVWPDFPVRALIDGSVATIKADAAQRSFDAAGQGITWAIVDSGIDGGHPHFATYDTLGGDVAELHRDFTATDSGPASVASALTDPNGHGTHVAGILAGGLPLQPPADLVHRVFEHEQVVLNGRVRRQVRQREVADAWRLAGVAPRCKLVSLKALDASGNSSTSTIIRALQYLHEEVNGGGQLLRIQGVNLSLGYEFDAEWYACGQSPLCKEVNRLVRAGVVVVAAAGNTGYGDLTSRQGQTSSGLALTINDPGNADLAITVGSTHRDSPYTFGVSFFSSKGPTGDGRLKPDLIAPGERITSCATGTMLAGVLPAMRPAGAACYIDHSGTSMAAPHVSGAVAAFLSVRREFISRPEEVKRIFLESATSLGRERYFEGHGLVDLMRAIQSV